MEGSLKLQIRRSWTITPHIWPVCLAVFTGATDTAADAWQRSETDCDRARSVSRREGETLDRANPLGANPVSTLCPALVILVQRLP